MINKNKKQANKCRNKQFRVAFHQILFCVHPAFHNKVSQLVYKASQITKSCVNPRTQKTSNCWKLVTAKNKMNQHRSSHQKMAPEKTKSCRFCSCFVISTNIVKILGEIKAALECFFCKNQKC